MIKIIKDVATTAVADTLETLLQQRERIDQHLQFLNNHSQGNPHFEYVLWFASRYVAEQQSSDPIVELDDRVLKNVRRLSGSFHMEQSQLQKLARLLWLVDSFSNVPRDSRQLSLYKMPGLDQRLSFDAIARTNAFAIDTYECPGNLETWAELGIGYSALVALATAKNAGLRLYGIEGAARNRHLTRTTVKERSELYEARASLLDTFNFPIKRIDIPEGGFKIPDNFALARALHDLDYSSREVDRDFVTYLIGQKGARLIRGSVIESVLKKHVSEEILKRYTAEGLDEGIYRTLIEELKKPLKEAGLSILAREGVHDLGDILFKAVEYRNPQGEADQASQRRAKIWKHLLQTDIAEETMRQFTSVVPRYKTAPGKPGAMSEEDKKGSIEYFIGEVLEILRPLFQSPHQAFIKFGNPTEGYWDETVHKILANEKMTRDAIWLFGDLIGQQYSSNQVPTTAPLVSLLYSHFNFLNQGRSSTFIAYGIAPTTEQIGAIPLISDDPSELRRKFEGMAQSNPNELSRLVIGTVYSLINPGDGSARSRATATKNKKVLLAAASELPEAYKRSISILDPLGVSAVIDSKLEARLERSYATPNLLCIDHFAAQGARLSTSLKDKYGSISDPDLATRDAATLMIQYAERISFTLSEFSKIVQELARLPEQDQSDKTGTYLQIAADTITGIKHRDFVVNRNVNLRSSTNPFIAEAKSELRSMLQAANECADAIASQFIERVDRSDMAHYLDKRFRTNYERINEGIEYAACLEEPEKLKGAMQKLVNKHTSGEKQRELKGSIDSLTAKGADGMIELLYKISGVSEDRLDRMKSMHKYKRRLAFRLFGRASDPIYLENEIYLLEKIDNQLARQERVYMDETKSARYASTSMLPHELQQASALRNTLATWIRYYRQSNQYLSEECEALPLNPYNFKAQSKSRFAITPDQAARFFTTVSDHLKSELGPQYFQAQRARAHALTKA